jgi:hypothetical protein
MKKLFILSGLMLIALCMTSYSYAYTYVEHDNVIATDSPYAITYTEEAFSVDWNKVELILSPTTGYNFYGSYVMTIFNLFDDVRLAPHDTLFQDGWIGTFPNQIPNYVSVFKVELFSNEDVLKQKINVAAYQGDIAMFMARFNLTAAADDYFVITILLDAEIDTAQFVTSIMQDSSDIMIRVNSISVEEYNRIFAEGYIAAQNEIETNYDDLIAEIVQLQADIALLESQLDDVPETGSPMISNTDFISDNLGYILIIAVGVLAFGIWLGSRKKRYGRKRW